MALTNEWVGYLQRSYSDIKKALIGRLKDKVPEMTDHSESNLMIILISMFAGLTEQLNYYIDNMARESFLLSARRYSSVVRLTKLLDYQIKANIPASVDVTVNFSGPLPSTYTIPIGTIFTTDNGIEYITTSSVQALAGATSIVLPTSQKTEISALNLGLTNGLGNQKLTLPTDYVHDSISIKVGTDTTWLYQTTLGLSGPTDKHYTVELTEDGVIALKFGDGVNGLVPPGSQTVLFYGFSTEGSNGNVEAGAITKIQSVLTLPGGITINTITNELSAVGGLDVESINSIKLKAPLSIRTLDRAVTRQDYIDIAKLAPGVSKADLFFECGKTIEIFISPEGGGIAQASLLSTTKNYIDQRKMVTTFVDVRPAGESIINIKLTATAKFRESGILTEADIRNALLDKYSYENSDVNRKVRKSDIYALVDNLARVDYLILDELSLLPYARPIAHTIQLSWNRTINVGSNQRVNWKVEYNGVNFNVFKEGAYIGNASIGTPYTDPNNIITFTINASAYIGGQEWEFVTEPYNQDITTDDYSLPVTDTNFLSITVIEQLVTNN